MVGGWQTKFNVSFRLRSQDHSHRVRARVRAWPEPELEKKTEYLTRTVADIREYAPKIGIDVSKEPHLLYLARDALNTKLPDYWKPWYEIIETHEIHFFLFLICSFSEKHGEWYYFNTVTGESQWEHPVDGWYRRVISQRRSWHDDSADQGGCESEDSDQTICDNLTHIKKSHKGKLGDHI